MDAHSSLLRQLRIAAMAAEIIFFEDTETATAVGQECHTEPGASVCDFSMSFFNFALSASKFFRHFLNAFRA